MFELNGVLMWFSDSRWWFSTESNLQKIGELIKIPATGRILAFTAVRCENVLSKELATVGWNKSKADFQNFIELANHRIDQSINCLPSPHSFYLPAKPLICLMIYNCRAKHSCWCLYSVFIVMSFWIMAFLFKSWHCLVLILGKHEYPVNGNNIAFALSRSWCLRAQFSAVFTSKSVRKCWNLPTRKWYVSSGRRLLN